MRSNRCGTASGTRRMSPRASRSSLMIVVYHPIDARSHSSGLVRANLVGQVAEEQARSGPGNGRQDRGAHRFVHRLLDRGRLATLGMLHLDPAHTLS